MRADNQSLMVIAPQQHLFSNHDRLALTVQFELKQRKIVPQKLLNIQCLGNAHIW
jgi:hypothetical protein